MDNFIAVLKKYSDFESSSSRKEYWMLLIIFIPFIGPIWLLFLLLQKGDSLNEFFANDSSYKQTEKKEQLSNEKKSCCSNNKEEKKDTENSASIAFDEINSN
tara:strand:+ start:20522 stop:20827 length:306 start_codon:yes stop_codon:yes gene_type:complete